MVVKLAECWKHLSSCVERFNPIPDWKKGRRKHWLGLFPILQAVFFERMTLFMPDTWQGSTGQDRAGHMQCCMVPSELKIMEVFWTDFRKQKWTEHARNIPWQWQSLFQLIWPHCLLSKFLLSSHDRRCRKHEEHYPIRGLSNLLQSF